MNTGLLSLSKIFTEKILRIPDYQRGYAWTKKQLNDFWNDLILLEDGKNHYIGVITVEKVNNTIYKKWEDDLWIIESKNYEPLYIVDGQQRLTTSIILIQSIIESVKEDEKLNYTDISEIKKKFIFESKDGGISRSYIFGYEKDNPSYDYLKTEIFKEKLEELDKNIETIYTNNLENAISFFKEKLKELNNKKIESIYKKLTQDFLFNLYSISEEIDVFIAFETMNNRGKPLSDLELLKNRLIYLSTKFNIEESENKKLRKVINEAWKSIYHNLGRNKLNPLDDDDFLKNHFSTYFFKDNIEEEESIFNPFLDFNSKSDRYVSYLLEKFFIIKSIRNNKLSIKNIKEYVGDLQNSVEIWYKILNPNTKNGYTKKENYWLDKINKLNIKSVAGLVMIFFKDESDEKLRILFLKELEKYLYYIYLSNSYFSRETSELITVFIKFKKESNAFISYLREESGKIIDNEDFKNNLIKRIKQRGFYNWGGIKYFLFEYDLFLSEKSKNDYNKIDWNVFQQKNLITNNYYFFESPYDFYKDNNHTIEHIYPQTANKKCWTNNFSKYSTTEKNILRNSIGNLLPLTGRKNSSLGNKCFKEKISSKDKTIGYRFGCYSENEITEFSEWTAKEILERGIRLLDFMEKRWNLKFGNIDEKIKILNLNFVLQKENIKIENLNIKLLDNVKIKY